MYTDQPAAHPVLTAFVAHPRLTRWNGRWCATRATLIEDAMIDLEHIARGVVGRARSIRWLNALTVDALVILAAEETA